LTARREPGQLLTVTDSSPAQPFVQPFDERSALEELEQLADKIQLSRRQREQKVAEFDVFVRTFRHDRYAASIAATEHERRAEDRPAASGAATHAAGAVLPATKAGASPVSTSVAEAAPVPEPTTSGAAVPFEPVAHAAMNRPDRPRAAYIGVALAALAVVLVTVLLWRSTGAPVGPAQADPRAVAAPATPASASVAAPAAPAPAPTVPAGPPRALNVEFVTVRPVWARITVDGRRAMEREFTADQRIPFSADRAIVIRAGDAGAIRLVVDGKDLGVLGRDGQIFERTFTPQAK
jgi:hypothetical protein